MTLPKHILIVFLDGVGLGDDTEANPFLKYPPQFLTGLFDGNLILKKNQGYQNQQATLLGLDANLGVAGLPQSGTGQTAILTGLNAPALLGKHDGPYPNKFLRELLAKKTFFSELVARGKKVAYGGAYPDSFHNRLSRGKGRLSANTRAAYLAGLKLRGLDDLIAGQAISGMLTNHYWRNWGYDVPLLSAVEAGQQLVSLAESYDLTYFEFWYTDAVGHKQDYGQAQDVLTLLDDFFAGIAHTLDPANMLFLVISDHGNFEDLGTKHHTANLALAIAIGWQHQRALKQLKSTADIASFVLSQLTD
ncbi:MAG: peptidase [Chloroflexota bacterium]